MCKECRRDDSRKYRQKNKDYCREYNREYKQKNKDRIREYKQAPVGRLVESIYYLRRKTGATIYVRDMTEEQKETLANQYVAVRTLEKTEKEILAASGKRRCPRCGGVFDFDMFYKKKGGKHEAACRECVAKHKRKYYQQNKDKRNEYDRKYYQQNKEKIKERKRAYYEKNKDNKNKKALDKTKSIPDNRE